MQMGNGSYHNNLNTIDMKKDMWKDKVSVKCYGQTDEWETRRKAYNHFLKGAMYCDGAEAERYMNICCDLKSGATFVDGDSY